MIEIFEKYKHTLNGTIRRCMKKWAQYSENDFYHGN